MIIYLVLHMVIWLLASVLIYMHQRKMRIDPMYEREFQSGDDPGLIYEKAPPIAIVWILIFMLVPIIGEISIFIHALVYAVHQINKGLSSIRHDGFFRVKKINKISLDVVNRKPPGPQDYVARAQRDWDRKMHEGI